MTIETTSQYYDCECDVDYIHVPMAPGCPNCKAQYHEQPDSRVNEVLAAGLPLKATARNTKKGDTLIDEWGRAIFIHAIDPYYTSYSVVGCYRWTVRTQQFFDNDRTHKVTT